MFFFNEDREVLKNVDAKFTSIHQDISKMFLAIDLLSDEIKFLKSEIIYIRQILELNNSKPKKK